MNIYRLAVWILLFSAAMAAQQTTSCAGLPPGRHALLERFSAQLDLTCEQQLKIEPLLHDEESVSKPLLRSTFLSPEEKQHMILTVKLAARRQIRTLLTPDQQKKMDEDIAYVARNGKEPGMKSNRKKKVSNVETSRDVFADEESLSDAIQKYTALSSEERRSMLVTVKEAALRDSNQLSSDQQKKLDAEVQELKK